MISSIGFLLLSKPSHANQIRRRPINLNWSESSHYTALHDPVMVKSLHSCRSSPRKRLDLIMTTRTGRRPFHMSTTSLNLNTPSAFTTPSTPSGTRGFPRSVCSDILTTSTSPATLIDSMSAGTRSTRRDLQIKPIRLLDCAVRTASLTEKEFRSLSLLPRGLVAGSSEPRLLQSRTGSALGEPSPVQNEACDGS